MSEAVSRKGLLVGICLIVSLTARAVTVAVWDPETETTEHRFKLEPKTVQALAQGLKAVGAEVDLLTAERLAGGALDPNRYEAFLTYGSALPRTLVKPTKDYAENGGVVVTIAEGVPFLLGVEKDKTGEWRLQPATPTFAWQMYDVMGAFGLKYVFKPEYHDQGVRHSPSPWALKLCPGLQSWEGRRKAMWVIPDGPARYIPLLASYRVDGLEVPGALYGMINGRRRAIVCTTPALFTGTERAGWNSSDRYFRLLTAAITGLRDTTWKPADVHEIDTAPAPPVRQPLDAKATGAVEPDGASAVKRWGRFDGSCFELPKKAGSDQLPRVLPPGGTAHLVPQAAKGQAAVYLRIRGSYGAADAGLKVVVGGQLLWNERFLTVDTAQAGNYCPSYTGNPYVFTRSVFVPQELLVKKGGIVLSNPGMTDTWFDAIQLETRPTPRIRRLGLGASRDYKIPKSESARWDSVRFSLRTQFAQPEGAENRFAKIDEIVRCCRAQNGRLEPIIEGTPAWAPISEERLTAAQKAFRPTTVPPDPGKYVRLLEDLLPRYKDLFDVYEIWNEADIPQFYRGNATEYAQLFHRVSEVIRQVDPTAKICPSGMAGYHPEFLRGLLDNKVLAAADFVALHPYCGDSPAWDLTYGLTESWLFAHGVDREIYCNESGFPSVKVPHFKSQKDMTPRQQALSLNAGLARLLANGVARVSVFNAGGVDDAFGVFDRNGKPKPSYRVFSDYLELGGEGAVKEDVSLIRADGEPLSGVYVAASRKPDGVCVVVVNPAEATLSHPLEVVLTVPKGGNAITRTLQLDKRTVLNVK